MVIRTEGNSGLVCVNGDMIRVSRGGVAGRAISPTGRQIFDSDTEWSGVTLYKGALSQAVIAGLRKRGGTL